MNVGWGKRGTAQSAPVVINEVVTVEAQHARAAPRPAKQIRTKGVRGMPAAAECSAAECTSLDSPRFSVKSSSTLV